MSIQEACRLSSKPHDKTAQTKDELVFFFALAESHGCPLIISPNSSGLLSPPKGRVNSMLREFPAVEEVEKDIRLQTGAKISLQDKTRIGEEIVEGGEVSRLYFCRATMFSPQKGVTLIDSLKDLKRVYNALGNDAILKNFLLDAFSATRVPFVFPANVFEARNRLPVQDSLFAIGNKMVSYWKDSVFVQVLEKENKVLIFPRISPKNFDFALSAEQIQTQALYPQRIPAAS